MRARGKLCVAAMIGTLGLVSAPVSGASAGTGATLSLSGFHQILADSAHGHLFISEGSTSKNSIIVTNLSGQQVATIGGQEGVMGIVLSPDRKTLYAALASGHAVTAISTATLNETASYPTGSISPYDVAVQGGKVWVSYHTGSSTGGTSAIGYVNPAAAKPVFVAKAVAFGPVWQSAAQLGGDPADTGILLAAEPGGDPTSIAAYDVFNGDLAEKDYFSTCGNEHDLAVVPGGQQFLLACGWPYVIDRYGFGIYTGFSSKGSYSATTYPDAVAIAANGTVAASTESTLGGELYVYREGSRTPLLTDSINGLAAGGLAWSADGTRLYAVSEVSSGAYTVNLVDVPPLAASPYLTLSTGAASVNYGSTIHVAAHLGPTYTNRTVSIYAQPAGGSRKLLETGTVNASGNLAVSYVALHSTTFSAVFTGDTVFAPKTVTRAVGVRAKVSMGLSGYYASTKVGSITYRLYHRSGRVTVAITVAPSKSGQCVKLEVQEYYKSAWHANAITSCGILNSSSKVTRYMAVNSANLGYHYRVRADYVRSSKDTSNLSADSGWQYYMVEK